MNKILNTWSTVTSRQDFEVKKPVYENGDYRIYKLWDKNYLYTFKSVAINQLAGLNIPHLDSLAENKRPVGKYSSAHFLFDRALESKARGLSMLKH